MATSAGQPAFFRLVPGDINGFLGLVVDNLSVLGLLAAVLIGGYGVPADIVFGKMFPGTALGVLVGDLAYTWLAVRLARRTGRDDVTATATDCFVEDSMVRLFRPEFLRDAHAVQERQKTQSFDLLMLGRWPIGDDAHPDAPGAKLLQRAQGGRIGVDESDVVAAVLGNEGLGRVRQIEASAGGAEDGFTRRKTVFVGRAQHGNGGTAQSFALGERCSPGLEGGVSVEQGVVKVEKYKTSHDRAETGRDFSS